MKAMVLEKQAPVETRPLKMKEVDTPKVSGFEMLLKVQACGLCHTDVHIVEGEVFKGANLPLILGHEVVGVVEEKGEKVKNFEIGNRAGVGWIYNSCLKCEQCLQGKENLCPNRESVGFDNSGGYAEYVKVDSRFATKIPDNLKSEEAAPLFCAGLTAYRATKRVSPKPSDKIAVIGIGGLGSYAVQFAKMSGAKVFAFSRSPEHFELAKNLGADDAVDSSVDLVDKMKNLGITIALVFAPSAGVLEQALMGVARGGVVLMAANIEKTAAMDYRKTLAGEKILTTVSVGTRQDMADLMDLAAEGKVKSQIETMKLENANEALIRVKEGKVVGRIVLVA